MELFLNLTFWPGMAICAYLVAKVFWDRWRSR